MAPESLPPPPPPVAEVLGSCGPLCASSPRRLRVPLRTSPKDTREGYRGHEVARKAASPPRPLSAHASSGPPGSSDRTRRSPMTYASCPGAVRPPRPIAPPGARARRGGGDA